MSNSRFPIHLSNKLEKLKLEFQYRQLKVNADAIDFYSNDYLGFLLDSKRSGPSKLIGSGAGGSRLISGNSNEIEQLEQTIANFHHAEAALVYPSGYQANIGLYNVIAGRGDTLLFDEACHASIRDGLRLSHASGISFKHNNLDDLTTKLGQSSGHVYIVVESLYSMDGDIAPLDELAQICKETGALLIVDEAHALGVFGPNGEGLVYSNDVINACIARVYGFGKAVGCQGAAIVGDTELKELLVNYSRSFIFSTGISPLLVDAIAKAYQKLSKSNTLRSALHRNIAYFNSKFKGVELLLNENSESPIMALRAKNSEHVLNYAQAIASAGMNVKGIRWPTVPRNQERIRISLHAFNTESEIDLLFATASTAY
jgi:8-amino-7-oxononanoate synthase